MFPLGHNYVQALLFALVRLTSKSELQNRQSFPFETMTDQKPKHNLHRHRPESRQMETGHPEPYTKPFCLF